MNSELIYITMLSEVHKMLRLYLALPISLGTSERAFSALKHVLTYQDIASLSAFLLCY